ncbi:MAG TPA: DedA family protein [Burkholderiaceae bacterium]|nr:DedA family protein [Burkholderiaceae bacterium]
MPNDLPALVAQYGLFAVLLGCILEGEAVLLLASASAHLGMLDIRAVVAVAATGAFIGDNLFFLLGRHWGVHVTEHVPWLARVVPRVDRMLARWRWGAVVVLRFTYGLRTGGPMLLGAGTMPLWEFVAANALGAAIWAVVIATIGYTAGQAIEGLLGNVAHVEKLVLGLVIAIALAAIIIRALLRRRSTRRQ